MLLLFWTRPARVEDDERRARTPFFMLVFVLATAALLSVSACKNQGGAGGADNSQANGPQGGEAHERTYATPPFQTREPERYQARMVLTYDLGGQVETSSTFIARDGERRREDYEPGPHLTVSDLETPTGHFLLLRERKLYAELTEKEEAQALSSGIGAGPIIQPPEDFSPDRLINEARTEARYEQLGVEDWNGRSVTKYRVTVVGAAGSDEEQKNSAPTERLIWVDERLGMPVRSETTSSGAGAPSMKYSMQLLDIKEETDGSAFDLPRDYRKVSAREILDQIGGAQLPAQPQQQERNAAAPED